LVEALIVAGVVAIATAGVYKFYSTVQAREQSHQESQNLLQVTNNVLRAYSAMPNFSGVSNARLVTEALLPSGMEVLGSASNPTIGSLFGSTLTVAPMTLDGNVGGGLVLTYSGVPRKNCAQFVANASAGYNFRDITVNDQNVLGTNRSLDQARVSAQCNSGPESTVTFTVQHGVQGTAALAAAACTVPASSPETQTVSCPSGYAGSITQTRTATCPFGAALPVWSEWSVISNTCVQVLYSRYRLHLKHGPLLPVLLDRSVRLPSGVFLLVQQAKQPDLPLGVPGRSSPTRVRRSVSCLRMKHVHLVARLAKAAF